MSAYLTYAPVLEHTAIENTSAFPQAPQVVPATGRPRFVVAALLRRTARLELALAARLDHSAPRRLATA